MSSFFIDKTDPHIAEILERLRRVNKILQKTETLVQPTLNNERFLTDEELSKISASQFEDNGVIVLEEVPIPVALHIERNIIHHRIRIFEDMRVIPHVCKLR